MPRSIRGKAIHNILNKSRKSTKPFNKTKQSGKVVGGSVGSVKAQKNYTAKQGGMIVDNKTTADNSKKILTAQARVVTESTEVSTKEGSLLNSKLRKVGVNIAPDISHHDVIINILSDDSNTLLDSLKQRLQKHRLKCILVDFLTSTDAHKKLVKFLIRLGVELKIVGTETFMQLGCECGHISSQVIHLLANHGADWWLIPKDKFAECASDKKYS